MRSTFLRLIVVTGFFVALSLATASARAEEPWCGMDPLRRKCGPKEPCHPKPLDPKTMVSLDTSLL